MSTGRTYTASVVGTDPTDDVAVIQLSGASGLQTASIGDATGVSSGDAVTGVGNAGGTGGTPSAAGGQVVAVNQQLTASDNNGANAEHLTGMIEINAPIEAGDSGGPLYNSVGKVIGIDTAAQTNGRTHDGRRTRSRSTRRLASRPRSNRARRQARSTSGFPASSVCPWPPPPTAR